MKDISKVITDEKGNTVNEAINISEENQCVELSVDSKGKVKPTVKVYANTIEEASKKATQIMDALLEKYGDG